MDKKRKKNKIVRYAIMALEVAAVSVVAYIIFSPLLPLVQFELLNKNIMPGRKNSVASRTAQKDLITEEVSASSTVPGINIDTGLTGDRLIIPKIGVNAFISKQIDSTKGLNEGVWLFPDGSRPDLGGNTTISGHRWKYLPPNNTTLYLLDKVEIGDDIYVKWKDRVYDYRVKEIKIVKPTDVYILNPTVKPTLTVYTCTPLYSQKNRLVVIGELVE